MIFNHIKVMSITTHKWYKDLSTCLNECCYYFVDDNSGIRYCIHLQLDTTDTFWSVDLYKCNQDDDWTFTDCWGSVVLPDKYYEWDYRTLQLDVVLAVQRLFPNAKWPEIQYRLDDIEETVLTHDSMRMPNSLLCMDSFSPELSCPNELYVKGNVGLLDVGHHVAIIGARDATNDEMALAYNYGKYHSSDVVISGLARGIDTAAHQGCVDSKGRSIAVIASGLDVTYPKENSGLVRKILLNRGLIVSEHPYGSKANPSRLVARTRIQMALANKVVVIACEKESGTMHAVNFAIKLGRPIFAVNSGRSGNRYLIDNGIATPI
jgi:DNA protecting protein DprA